MTVDVAGTTIQPDVVFGVLPDRLNWVVAQLQLYSFQAGPMGMQAIGVGQAQDAGLTAATGRERLEATADIVAAALLWRRTQPQS